MKKRKKSAIQVAPLNGVKAKNIPDNATVEFHTLGGVLTVCLTGGGHLRIDHRDHHSLAIRPISHDALVISTQGQNDV